MSCHSVLPVPWLHRAWKDPSDRQHGPLRVQALRQEDPERAADHVPV